MPREEDWEKVLAIPAHPSNGMPLLVAIGPLLVDIVVRDFSVPWSSPGSWVSRRWPVSIQVGGTAVHACAGFGDVGFHSVVVSVLGGVESRNGAVRPDDLGSYVLSVLDQRGQRHEVEVSRDVTTGRALLLYPSEGGRMMFADASELSAMSPGHVSASIEKVAQESRLIVGSFSGYLYFSDATERMRSAALSVLRSVGGLVWVDVVPHNLYLSHSFEDFCSSLSGVDLVSLDVETCQGFADRAGLTRAEVLASLRALGSTVFLDHPRGVHIFGGEEPWVLSTSDAQRLERVPGGTDRTVARAVARHVARYYCASCP